MPGMAKTARATTPEDPDAPDEPDTPDEPDELQAKFLAGDIGWRDYIAARRAA
jgi:hypothetical protein